MGQGCRLAIRQSQSVVWGENLPFLLEFTSSVLFLFSGVLPLSLYPVDFFPCSKNVVIMGGGGAGWGET